MATGSLFSGRSRHASRKVRPRHDSTRSKRHREEREEDETRQPAVDELRQRRVAYHSASAAEKRSIANTAPKMSASAGTKTSSRRTSASKRRTTTSTERRHRTKTTRTIPHEDDIDSSETQRRTEDYVYGPRSSLDDDSGVQDDDRRGYDSRRSDKRRSQGSRSSHRHSLPTVLESEVTPDDSISQVGLRDRPDRRRMNAYVRPSLKRSSTTSAKLEPVSEAPEDAASIATSRRSSRHEPSLLGSFMRRHSTSSVPTKPRLVECLTCGSDDVPHNKSAKLACSHRMCHDCLKRVFEMSVKDPVHMPPKCCTDEHIPLDHVDKLFDTKFKVLWNRKYQEYHTKNRIYCPIPKCGEWIKPSHIHTIQGRKYALCPRCKTKVCTICNNKMHKSDECPKDPEIAKLVEQAKEKGWQRCYSCSALVEKKEGCNHMTCRCTAEFCIVCGSMWKTCECPLFNYNNVLGGDRLNDMRVPQNIPQPIQNIYRNVFRYAADAMAQPPPPPPPPPMAANPGQALPRNARNAPPPELTYQQEQDRRRRQEREDEELARRLQNASFLNDDNLLELGNAARHFMNDDFVQNAANVVMNAFGDPNFGRRGERQAGRRRRARQAAQNDDDPGLAPNFLGDESVLGVGPGTRHGRTQTQM